MWKKLKIFNISNGVKKIIFFSLIIIFFLLIVPIFSRAWTEPQSFPPDANISALLTGGDAVENKIGSLFIKGDSVTSKGLNLGTDSTFSSFLQLTAANDNLLYGVIDYDGSLGKLLKLETYSGGAYTTRLAVTKDGKVGVGTEDPITPLHIKTNTGALYLETARDVNSSPLMLSHTLPIDATNIEWAHSIRSNNKDYWIFGTDGTIYKDFIKFNWDTGYSIFEDGGIGIGTVSPNVPLHVKSADNKAIRIDTKAGANGMEIMLEREGTDLTWVHSLRNNDEDYWIYASNDVIPQTKNFLKFDWDTGNTIFEAGKVGIGTDNPENSLHIVKSTDPGVSVRLSTDKIGGETGIHMRQSNEAMDFNLKWTQTGGVSRLGFFSDDASMGGVVTNEWMSILENGNVGIGISDPTYTLHVNGSFAAQYKNFDIVDPRYNNAKIRLVHSSIEGPEHAVYYRGEAKLKNGKAIIKLPDYFEALTGKEGRTLLLTCKNGWSPLYGDGDIKNGEFTVKTTSIGNSSQIFYWEVKAIRADIPFLKPSKVLE